ncbi:MAG: hypothetical protein RSA70_02165, partial [Clostridia bacterium]
MFNFNIYNEAYAKIGNLTPISADCGVLCSARCCKGGEDAGMILFPGEEVFLKNKSFVKLTQRDMCGYRVWFAVCNGACPRANRPLSCRIFPLSPRYEDGKLTIE